MSPLTARPDAAKIFSMRLFIYQISTYYYSYDGYSSILRREIRKIHNHGAGLYLPKWRAPFGKLPGYDKNRKEKKFAKSVHYPRYYE